MKAYEGGGHAYHATMPTDGLMHFRDQMFATRRLGSSGERGAMGAGPRCGAMRLGPRDFKGVAARDSVAPGVGRCLYGPAKLKSGAGLPRKVCRSQAGVPLMVGEGRVS
jgi:hypothetical protein